MVESLTVCGLEVGPISDYFVGISTLLLAVTAIWGDWLRAKLRPAKLEIKSEPGLFEHLAPSGSTGGHEGKADDPKAASYTVRIAVANTGNRDALDCRISIVGARRSKGNPWNGDAGQVLVWCGSSDTRRTIYRDDRPPLVDIFTFTSPSEEPSAPGGDPKVVTDYVGKTPVPQASGLWEIDLLVEAANLPKPLRQTVTIEWDGKWHSRASEMRARATISVSKPTRKPKAT